MTRQICPPIDILRIAQRLNLTKTADRAQVKEMMSAQRRQGNWTTEEDRRLLELIDAGKS
jgi:hypothetical protein